MTPIMERMADDYPLMWECLEVHFTPVGKVTIAHDLGPFRQMRALKEKLVLAFKAEFDDSTEFRVQPVGFGAAPDVVLY